MFCNTLLSVEEWQEVIDNIHCLLTRHVVQNTDLKKLQRLSHAVAQESPCAWWAVQILAPPIPSALTCPDLSADSWVSYSSHSCLWPIRHSEDDLTSDSIFCAVKTFKILLYLCFPSTVGFCTLQLPTSLWLQGFLTHCRPTIMLRLFPWHDGRENAVWFAFYLERAILHGIHLPSDYVSCFLWSFFMERKKVCYSSVI